MHMFVQDRSRELGGGRYGCWHLVQSGDLGARLKEYNAARAEHIDRMAIIVYDDGRIRVGEDRILNDEFRRLAPGEWVIDENDPSTWDNQYREKHRMEGFLKSVARLEVDSPKMTTEQEQAVVALLHSWCIQPPEFWNLFTHPGEWRHIDNWEHKLRQVRNDTEIKLWGEA